MTDRGYADPFNTIDNLRARAEKAEVRNKMLEVKQDTAYIRGYREGVTEYAWWKDGTQYVGTCGLTLDAALRRMKGVAHE